MISTNAIINFYAADPVLNLRKVTASLKKVRKPKTHPDQKYIDALLNNNAELVEELYVKFSGKIKTMVLQNNGSETDAADIFQDALLSLYQKAKTKNFVVTCPLEAFLYLICKNRWMNELSKRRHNKTKCGDTEKYETAYDSFKQTEDNNLQKARRELLMEKVAQLSKSTQELLHLSWSGKSMEEVAEILNVNYGYARKKKSEAMAKLVKLVKESSEFKRLKW